MGCTRATECSLTPTEPMFVCGPWLPGRKDYECPRACRPVAAHSHQDQGMTDAHIKLALVGAMQQRASPHPLIPKVHPLVVVSLLVSSPSRTENDVFPIEHVFGAGHRFAGQICTAETHESVACGSLSREGSPTPNHTCGEYPLGDRSVAVKQLQANGLPLIPKVTALAVASPFLRSTNTEPRL